MTKIGLIGFGSMGEMLSRGFLETGVVREENFTLCNRTFDKLRVIKSQYPKLNVCRNADDLVLESEIVLLCVKPLEIKGVLDIISEKLDPKRHHLVSIAGCVTIGNLESVFKGKISKVIPSLTSEVREGISLICHNGKVLESDAKAVEALFNKISQVKIVLEENFEAAADLTSCAPGLFSAIFDEFVRAGSRHSSFSRKEAEEMVKSTLLGTAKLLWEKKMSFDKTVQRVATKGGITEEGVKVLRSGLPVVFDEVFKKTLGKHEIVKNRVREQFLNSL